MISHPYTRNLLIGLTGGVCDESLAVAHITQCRIRWVWREATKRHVAKLMTDGGLVSKENELER